MADRGDVLAYRRRHGDRAFHVALNFGGDDQDTQAFGKGRIVVSTYLDREEVVDGPVHLRPNEGIVVQLGDD